MTPLTQDDLAAGRELDKLVAEALGWTFAHTEDEYDPRTPRSLALVGVTPDKHRLSVVPAYSTDIGAAWQVVDSLVPRGWYFGLSVGGRELDTDPVWEAGFSHYPDPEEEPETFIALAHTPALAICRAALKAVSAI